MEYGDTSSSTYRVPGILRTCLPSSPHPRLPAQLPPRSIAPMWLSEKYVYFFFRHLSHKSIKQMRRCSPCVSSPLTISPSLRSSFTLLPLISAAPHMHARHKCHDTIHSTVNHNDFNFVSPSSLSTLPATLLIRSPLLRAITIEELLLFPRYIFFLRKKRRKQRKKRK